MTYRAQLSVPAEAQGVEISEWWAANRPKAPGLFDREVARALVLLETAPMSGVRLRGRHQGLRRVLLHKTRYYLYYEVDDEARLVTVLAIWHTSKGVGPPL